MFWRFFTKLFMNFFVHVGNHGHIHIKNLCGEGGVRQKWRSFQSNFQRFLDFIAISTFCWHSTSRILLNALNCVSVTFRNMVVETKKVSLKRDFSRGSPKLVFNTLLPWSVTMLYKVKLNASRRSKPKTHLNTRQFKAHLGSVSVFFITSSIIIRRRNFQDEKKQKSFSSLEQRSFYALAQKSFINYLS